MAQPSAFFCDFPGCGLSYRRKEHLTRHAKKHVQTQSYPCPVCGSNFARNDTLRHHIRTHHKDTALLPTSRTIQACAYCRSRRSKCNGQMPCEACLERDVECTYARHPRSRNERRMRVLENQPSPILAGEPDFLSLSQFLPTDMIPTQSLDSAEPNDCRVEPCIEAYFEKFHPHWPFLHPATFKAENEPRLLLQSVMMMGLWAMADSESRERAMSLHKKLTESIVAQRDTWDISTQDESEMQLQGFLGAPWPIATYQGILIQLIFAMFASGGPDFQLKHTLPETPSQLLVSLVRSCLRRDMFYYPSILAQCTSDSSPEVLTWLGVEETKRFALSLFKVCQNSRVNDPKILRDDPRRGSRSVEGTLLSFADLQFALPDSDERWHTPSNLASKVAANSEQYEADNSEGRWISHAAAVAQPHSNQFQWL